MDEVDSVVAPPFWRRLLARRRHRVLLVLLLFTVAFRIVLPSILRRVVVAEADKAMVGHLEIDDVDLALVTGGFTLHGLRVFARPAATPASTTAPAASPLTPPRAGEGEAGSAPVF